MLSTLVALLALTSQQVVSLPVSDGGTIPADIYGNGDRGIVLAHGGRFTREGWAKQAEVLAANGFRVLSIDFRESHGKFDILDAIHYMRNKGAKSVSVVGASMGGDYAAEAAEAEPDAMDRLVLLASGAYTPVTKMKGPKLFILARDDANSDGPRLPKIRAQYEKASEPKKLIIVEGSAHAQFLFATDQGERVMREILEFLKRR